MNPQKHTLYLIPNLLSDTQTADDISPALKQIVHHLKYFIVEHEKSARALIKKLQLATSQNELYLAQWNEHSHKEDLPQIISWLSHHDVGIISEAGLPCVADPGADIVRWAHRNKVRVKPLGGASSILMALMASGMSGQSFVFHGYLPIDKNNRAKKIKELEADAVRKIQTQICMEAPYRNNSLLEDLCKTLNPETLLCVACEITSPTEYIETRSLREWQTNKPDLHKKPTIFVIGVS
jgi:16S rRNA (cytidine1402-2'-O)-methyltransferase